MLTRNQYRPGAEADAALGLTYTGWSIGKVTIAPVAQIKASARGSDRGDNASDPVASGFQRVLHAPAVHFKGKGFYNTDYGTRNRQRETAAAAEKSSSEKAVSMMF